MTMTLKEFARKGGKTTLMRRGKKHYQEIQKKSVMARKANSDKLQKEKKGIV
jgi:hypothetical protein